MTVLRGFVLLAAVGAGEYKDVVEACDATVKTTRQTKTNTKVKPRYDAGFQVYQQYYPSLRPSFVAIAELN